MRLYKILTKETKNPKTRSRAILLILSVVILTIFFTIDFGLNNNKVNAGVSHNLSGYAWSDNVGWISFNCTDLSSCSTTDYGVGINSSDGNLFGYAWSPNIGWITFNQSELSGCPSGTCVANLSQNTLSGWAKALSSSDSESGGWDGWISLNGGNYGVTFDISTNKFSGYAWGSDVIGWVDFNPQYGGIVKDSQISNTECSDGVDNDSDGKIDYPNDLGCTSLADDNESSSEFVTMSISANPIRVRIGDTTVITWSAGSVNSCSVSGTNGDSWQGTSGSQNTSAISEQVVYTLSCLDVENSTTNPQSVTISLIPVFEEF